MRYVSLFSGIEAASCAWDGLGFEPVAFSEIEPFPCAVLRERFSHVPNLGDVTQIDWTKVVEEHGSVDLVVGGSPCQSFSVAGGREGLDGASGLMWEYVRAVRELRPRWLLWENVPGALSSRTRDAAKGDDYRCLLSALDDLGYGLAWDVLDAQFFGVAQRRRRLFVVGRLGDPWSAAEVLFEPEGLRWDSPSGKQKRQELAALPGGGPGVGCLTPWDTQNRRVCSEDGTFPTLSARARGGQCQQAVAVRTANTGANGCGVSADVCHTLDAAGPEAVCYDTTQVTSPGNRSNPKPGDPCHTLLSGSLAPLLCIQEKVGDIAIAEDVAPPQKAGQARSPQVVCTQYGEEIAGTLTARHDSSPCADRGQNVICMGDGNAHAAINEECSGTLKVGYVVRRLMPVECERLQGFPDGWTDIEFKGKPASDSARYKALGNSMAVPVMRWLGERIEEVDLFGSAAEVP